MYSTAKGVKSSCRGGGCNCKGGFKCWWCVKCGTNMAFGDPKRHNDFRTVKWYDDDRYAVCEYCAKCMCCNKFIIDIEWAYVEPGKYACLPCYWKWCEEQRAIQRIKEADLHQQQLKNNASDE